MNLTFGPDISRSSPMTDDPSPIDRRLAAALSALDDLSRELILGGYDPVAAGVERLRTRLTHRVTDGVALEDDRRAAEGDLGHELRDLLPSDDGDEPWPL